MRRWRLADAVGERMEGHALREHYSGTAFAVCLAMLFDRGSAREVADVTGAGSEPEELSAREREIAQAYAGGASYRQIADRLFIAPTTVRTHLSTIYRKLGVSTKIELLRALEGAVAVTETIPSDAAPAGTAG